MGKPTFSPQISLGNVIQIGIVLVAVIGAWFNLDNRVQNNATDLATIRQNQKEFRVTTQALQIARARDDEKLANILLIVKDNKLALQRLARGGDR